MILFKVLMATTFSSIKLLIWTIVTLYVPFHLRQITHGPFLRKINWKIKCLTLLIVQEIRIRTNRPTSIFGPADLRISSLSPILSLYLSLLPHYYRYGPYPRLYPNYPHHQFCTYISVANVDLTLKSCIWTTFIMCTYISTCTNCVYVYVDYILKLNFTTWTIYTQVNGEQRK